jgi:hypothetical protein
MENIVEVMRVKRLPPMGKLVVEVGNQQFDRLSQIQDEMIKQLVVAAIGELIVFADGYQTVVDAGVAPPIITSTSAGDSNQEPSISEREASFYASLEQQRLAALAGDLDISRSEPDQVSNSTAIDPSQLEDDLDIAGQVDVFLQDQIYKDPDLRGRSIHIVGDPAGGLIITVDGVSYSKPTEITDTSVKSAIQLALREWDTGKLA